MRYAYQVQRSELVRIWYMLVHSRRPSSPGTNEALADLAIYQGFFSDGGRI